MILSRNRRLFDQVTLSLLGMKQVVSEDSAMAVGSIFLNKTLSGSTGPVCALHVIH